MRFPYEEKTCALTESSLRRVEWDSEAYTCGYIAAHTTPVNVEAASLCMFQFFSAGSLADAMQEFQQLNHRDFILCTTLALIHAHKLCQTVGMFACVVYVLRCMCVCVCVCVCVCTHVCACVYVGMVHVCVWGGGGMYMYVYR